MPRPHHQQEVDAPEDDEYSDNDGTLKDIEEQFQFGHIQAVGSDEYPACEHR